MLTCKNCGGQIHLDPQTKRLVCESCGSNQPLVNNVAPAIYDENSDVKDKVEVYRKALLLSEEHTFPSLQAAIGMLNRISDTLDVAELLTACQEEVAALKREEDYQRAKGNMTLGGVTALQNAANLLDILGDYKDCDELREQCGRLLAKAREEAEKQRLRQEKDKRRKQARARRRLLGVCLLVVAIIVGAVIVNAATYSASNISITLEPNDESYVTVKNGDAIFHYNAEIKNKGRLDVRQIEGTIMFETDDGEVLVDTSMSFSNYSSAVVRAGKSSRYTWDLTIYSDDTAIALYEMDFKDLKVKVDITEMTYTNGKTKRY